MRVSRPILFPRPARQTLLRLILGQEAPTSGVARLSEHNAVVGYFAQDQANALDLGRTVLQTMQDATEETNYEGLRALLGRFMFKARRRAPHAGDARARLSAPPLPSPLRRATTWTSASRCSRAARRGGSRSAA